MKSIILFACFLTSLNAYSQDSIAYKSIGIGSGVIYYPTGKIFGFAHSYSGNYIFSQHFGLQFSFDFGSGQKNDEFYFDAAKSNILNAGLVYIPFKQMMNLQLNTSLMFLKYTNIFGTKDEILNNNYAMSKFSTYKKSNYYGLNLGVQIPVYESSYFIVTTKLDSWISWIQLNVLTLKLQIQYKIGKK